MKKPHLFTLLIGVLLLSACAGTGETRGDYQYREVTKVEAPADQIYDEALTWMAQAFEESDDAIQLRDEDNRRIVANAVVHVSFSEITGSNVEMDMIVEARNNRFRMTGRNYELVSSSAYVSDRPLREGHIEYVEAKMDSLRHDLAGYIEESKTDQDW